MKRTWLVLSACALTASFVGCAIVPHGAPVYGQVSVGVATPYPPVVVVRPAPVIVGGYYGVQPGAYYRPAPRYYGYGGHGGHWGHR
jgi:hypothetical protein